MSSDSEYTGQVELSTVFGRDHASEKNLSAADKLRLIYRTGTEDPSAEPVPEVFQGGSTVVQAP